MLLHESSVHGSVSAHCMGVPATQTPAWHFSAPLQTWLSEHCGSLVQGHCAIAADPDSIANVTRTSIFRTSPPPLWSPAGTWIGPEIEARLMPREAPWTPANSTSHE